MARIPFRRRRPTGKVLRPIHPNVGIKVAYRRKLEALIDEMGRSVLYRVKAAYRADPPRMAQDAQGSGYDPGATGHELQGRALATDAMPAAELQDAVDEMSKRWEKRFDDAAEEMADWFAKKAYRRSDAALRTILKTAGWTVEFKFTPAMRDIFRATVQANVSLIKSIPQKYLEQVEGAVMRSVQTGRDLKGLTDELEGLGGVSRRRAAFIALDQNNKATSALQKARQLELGIEEGVWLHSHGGREPRPTHLANHGKKFNIAEGWFDPDPRVRERIMPGYLINCRCVWKPVVKGFS